MNLCNNIVRKRLFFYCIIFCGIALPTHGISSNSPDILDPLDPLDPNYYSHKNTTGSVTGYLGQIKGILEKGVGNLDEHAKGINEQLSAIENQQKNSTMLSVKNHYEIKLVQLEQGVIRKRLNLLEEQGEQSRKLLELLSRGVEKSLRFVNGVYGAIGLLGGILGTAAGGLIVMFIKKRLKAAKKENTTKGMVNEE